MLHRFRPLTGNYISQSGNPDLETTIRMGFRPLTGNYISQYFWKRITHRPCISFPSPYGELHFSMLGGNLDIYGIPESFRPLTGNYISQWKRCSVVCAVQWFPSPYGELHFSIISEHIVIQSEIAVSVPLRGTTFLNKYGKSSRHYAELFPSPYGELHFSMRYGKTKTCRNMFPSPYGELHFSMAKIFDAAPTGICFRPLTGNYISQ